MRRPQGPEDALGQCTLGVVDDLHLPRGTHRSPHGSVRSPDDRHARNQGLSDHVRKALSRETSSFPARNHEEIRLGDETSDLLWSQPELRSHKAPSNPRKGG